MILWLMLLLAAGTYQALPTNVQITPDTPLDSLTLDELDQLLSEKLVELQVDILKTYEEQLREHEETLHHLHRHRRESPPQVLVRQPLYPVLNPEAWHSYVFDTRPSREIASVKNLVTYVFMNVQTVMDVFPVALDDIHAIYKMDSGYGYILQDDKMHLLMVRNQWTNSPIGCACPGQPTDLRCACCAPGGVLCQVSASGVSNTCVEDSALGAQMCVPQSSKPLELDYAIAFEYHTFSEGVQQVVVIANGASVNFYKLDQWGLQDFHSLKGHNTITLDSDVSHLGYGEVFVEQFGTVARKRYLFTFGLDSSSKRYYEVVINPGDLSIETGFSMTWDTTGTSMKVWQNGGRVIIGVQDGTNLNIHELTSDRWGRQQISLQQVLSLPATVTSWRRYATGFDNFILATTPTFARIYMESRGEYQILQNLLPTGSLSSFIELVPVNLPSCKDEVILMTGLGNIVQIFVWDGTKGLYTLGNETTVPADITGWDKGFGDVRSISTAFPKLILKSTTGVVRIDVVAEMLHLEDPIWDESVALKNRKQYLENEYTRQREVMSDIDDRLNHSVDTVTTTVNITGDVTILDGIILDKTLTVTDLTASNLVFPNTDLSGISYSGYKDHLDQLANSATWLQTIDGTLTSIELELEDAVSVTTTKKINGRKVIVDGLTVQELNVDSAVFQKVLDTGDQIFPITSTLEGLVKFADPRKITGKKTFATRLDVTNLETGSLDDIPVSDVATTTGSYAVTGSVNFVNTLQARNVALPSGGTVGGIDLTNAVTLNGPAKLGYTIFNKNLTVSGNLQVDSTDVDGVIIEQLYRNALTKAGGKLKGPLAFTNDVTAKSLSASLLSGVNSPIFLSTTVFKDEASQLTGKIKVPTLTAKSLQVGDMVNGKAFPSDFPLKTDSTLNLGTKAFNDLTCESLVVDNSASVDGILFENLVTLHRAQTMTGIKTITNGVDIRGSLQVPSSLVAGVNFNELHANLTAILDPMGERFDCYCIEPVTAPTVVYAGQLNALNIVDLGQDIIYSADPTAAVSGTKLFTLPLSISHATFDTTFNGVSFEELVHSFSTTPIAGVKTFKKPVTFSSNLDVTGLVDGVDLKQLFDSALYLDKVGQVVTGRKTFTGTVSAGELDVQGRVSGVDFTKVLANSGAQTFTVPQKFAAASFGALDTSQIDMSDGFSMNGIDISVLDSIRMSRKNPTAHLGTLTVNGMVSVLGAFDAINIDGHNVAQLKNNIVTDDTDSIISSDLSFASLTVKGSVSTANKAGANGKNISRIHENAVLLGGNNAMTGSVTWGDLDLQDDIAVGGLVNGKDLQVVHNNAVYKDASSVQITGKKVFVSGLSVKGDIDTETTNGIDLSKRLFTLHTDQDITAAFTFDSVTAEKNLTLDGTFDGVDLERLNSQALKQSADNIGNIVFNGEVMVGDFKVAGNLENIDVNQRLQDAVRLTDSDIIIRGKKTFVSDVTFKNIFTTNLNNVDFNAYLSHAVRKNVPITLNRNIKVNGIVTAPSVTANSLAIQGSVDGIDYKDLMTKAVLLDGTQSSTSNLQFANDVSVTGNLAITRLNDLEVDTHYLTTNTQQTFITNVEVNDVHASTNVAVLGKVNNINLPAESLNTLKKSGGQTVTGLKRIEGLTIVSNNVEVTGKTGDDALVDFSTEVVYLTEAPTISGRLNFSSGLTVKSLTSTSGEIGDIDVVDLANKAWYYNKPALITASLNFTHPVVMKETLLTSHPVDGMLVSAVYGEAKSALETYSTYNEGIKSLYINKCPLIEEAYEDTQRAIFDADYFDLVHELQFSGKLKSSGSVRMGDFSYVVMSWDQTCDVTMHKYGTNFVHTTAQYSNVGSGKDWIDFEHNGNIFLIMAASAADNSCSRTNSVAFKLENGVLSVHQELVAGEKVEKAFVEETGSMGISITMGSTRHVYSFSSSNNLFEFVKTSPALDAMATIIDGDAVVVTGETEKMKMAVNGAILHEMEVLKVDDATLVKQYGKLYLMCSVTRQLVSGVVHNLELYLVDPTTGFSWLDSKPLNEPAKLTSFFTGNAATGTTLVVALQENWYPTAYTIHGMKYKPFVELNAPLTWWAEHFSVPHATFPEISKHALLIGQGNAVKLLELKMNGLTHEAEHVECNPGAFKYPELMPIVPV